ncbi:HNH/ENDO VII family nuclease [Pseudovibrio exalbescens]|uniref:HNH/ENDO VII family nuclease n=1 Tax=Pseudovibrio exalbescens TaxID=197461 RepID=UPI002365D664|nr:HNH/ENDO VII family nuclease [Pseudovibrio exalbescens]MDD7911539.1 HNH/ENDO VII family nuclease [Pseudovibrio exalbescens]
MSAAKKAGQLSDEAILRQLAQCGTSQQGFNLLDWIVSPALAGPASCTVRTNDGFTIHLTQEEGRQCLEAYLGIAIADPAKASKLTKWLAQGTLSAPVRAIGQLGALYSGPQSLGTDDQGVPLYLVDEKGRHLYKNDITGQYFFANPSNPTDIAMVATAMDLSALAASGTAFTTTRLPKSLKNVVDTPNGPKGTLASADDVAGHFQQNRRFWSQDPVQFNGNQVYQRNDLINPDRVSSWTINGQVKTGTNLERMADGRAPIGPDGKSVNLHHGLQTQNGPIMEMTQTFHKQNHGTIHINPNTIPSGINRSQFNTWSSNYWKDRSANWGQ